MTFKNILDVVTVPQFIAVRGYQSVRSILCMSEIDMTSTLNMWLCPELDLMS